MLHIEIQWNKNTSISSTFMERIIFKKDHILKFLDYFIFFESNSILLPHSTSNLYPFLIHLIFSPFISDFNGKIKYTQKIPFVLFLYTPHQEYREREWSLKESLVLLNARDMKQPKKKRAENAWKNIPQVERIFLPPCSLLFSWYFATMAKPKNCLMRNWIVISPAT